MKQRDGIVIVSLSLPSRYHQGLSMNNVREVVLTFDPLPPLNIKHEIYEPPIAMPDFGTRPTFDENIIHGWSHAM